MLAVGDQAGQAEAEGSHEWEWEEAEEPLALRRLEELATPVSEPTVAWALQCRVSLECYTASSMQTIRLVLPRLRFTGAELLDTASPLQGLCSDSRSVGGAVI